MRIDTAIQLGVGNMREHHFVRMRRVRKERNAVGWLLRQFEKPSTPCVFTITRIAPSNGLDPSENLPYACKAVVDAIADWMGVNDRKVDVVRYLYRNERGPYGLRIEA